VVGAGRRPAVADRRAITRRLAVTLFLPALALAIAGPVTAQAPDTTLPAGAEYQFRGSLSGLERWLYGTRYRALWATPVAAPGIELPGPFTEDQLAGPSEGRQAGFLRFSDAEGTRWVYRSLDRNLLLVAPEALRTNLLPAVIQGLNAGRHPGAAPIVLALAAAAGTRVPSSRMVRLEDSLPIPNGDGRLGYLRLADTTGLTTIQVLDSLRAGDARAFDAQAYLRERLFDTYLGSWDDAPDLWRWELSGTLARWTPRPRDRDRAFATYDGLLANWARRSVPGFVAFGTQYTSELGLMPLQRALDRQLLTVLDWDVWDSAATTMQRALTDSVIAEAVARQPPEYAELDSARLAATLRARRDALRQAARELYRLVNQEAALFGTSGADTVVVTQLPGDRVEVAFRDGRTRRFDSGDADAIALYLGGGPDLVELRGKEQGGPWVDIAWRPGLTVTGARGTGAGTTLFGGGEIPAGVRARVVRDTLAPPEIADVSFLRPKPVPLHGNAVSPAIWLDVNSDVGVLLGGGVNLTTYRAGHQPYYRWLQLKAAYATTPGDFAIELHAKFNRWRSQNAVTLDAGLSQIAVLHFFGYGNTTPYDQPIGYYRARQNQLYVYPAWNVRPTPATVFSIGPLFKHVLTDTTATTLLNASRPYGVPEFAQLGVLASATYDTRDAVHFTRHGILLAMGGSFYPVVFGSGRPFGGMRASAAAFVTPRRWQRATLAMRGTAQLALGDVPAHEAAYAGGSGTLRGYESGRYAGEAAVYFNNELRLQIGTLPFVVPWHFGLSGIADVGRVFASADSTRVWHASVGGGAWVAMPDRSVGGVITVVRSPQGTSIWLGTSFMF
jgi:hypothetical protein